MAPRGPWLRGSNPNPIRLRLLLQGSCSAPVPVGAAQFVVQGPALRSLVDCNDSSQAAVGHSSSTADERSDTDGSVGPSGEVGNGFVHSSHIAAERAVDGSSKRVHASKQRDGGTDKPGIASALPNGIHKAVAGSVSQHGSQQTAGRSQRPARQHSTEGATRPSEAPGQLLGLHPNAAAAPEPRLPCIAPLLPVWRSLATAMAPMFHPVRFRIAACLHHTACQVVHGLLSVLVVSSASSSPHMVKV